MRKTLKIIGLGGILMLASSLACAEPDAYRIDDTHSFANWTIRHVASKTSGTFGDIKGKILIDRQHLSNSSVEAKINMMSVNSNHVKRDEHIKKSEYLDVEKFSEMTFVSTKVEATNNSEGVITGNLSLHGVTKEMTFPFKVLGFGADPWGGFRMGIEAHTAIKASDFGFGWGVKPNAPVGDDIEITLLIEGVKMPMEIKLMK
ncbi:MAG: YceI family protein [Methylophilaceae bacterium]